MRYPLEQLLATVGAALTDDVVPHVENKTAQAQLTAVLDIVGRLTTAVQYRPDPMVAEIEQLVTVHEALELPVPRADADPRAPLAELEQTRADLAADLVEHIAANYADIQNRGLHATVAGLLLA
ncbi:MAG TPA: hypothetical protein VIW24_29795 [Aldersonia sp.]